MSKEKKQIITIGNVAIFSILIAITLMVKVGSTLANFAIIFLLSVVLGVIVKALRGGK